MIKIEGEVLMSYFENIKNYKIVDNLPGDYKKRLENLVEAYASQLDSGPLIGEIGFTPHDFSQHVADIYELYGKLFPKKYLDTIETKHKDSIFILLVATLFHDIAMIKENSVENREAHAKTSRDMFIEFFDEGGDGVVIQNVPQEYKYYIGEIIDAHSDQKKDGVIIRYTFDELCEKYDNKQEQLIVSSSGEEIDIPFLAAVLRLGDELDITQKRLSKSGYKRKNNVEDSIPHFILCELINDIQPNQERTIITIKPDINKCKLNVLFEAKPNESEIAICATNAALILTRYEKIKKEFRNLSERALMRTNHASAEDWSLVEIVLDEEEKLQAAVQKKRIVLKVNDEIKREVLSGNHFKSGHYRIEQDHINVRDWIDVEGLFGDDNWFLELIETGNGKDEFDEIIKNKDIIIGVNRFGSIVASRWGYKRGIPFSYFFSDAEFVDEIEYNIRANGAKNILLIVDVVIYGNTVEKLITKLKDNGIISENSKVELFVLFERFYKRNFYQKRHKNGYYYSDIYANECLSKIYIANDTFDVEICKKIENECPFSKEAECESCNSSPIYDETQLSCFEE